MNPEATRPNDNLDNPPNHNYKPFNPDIGTIMRANLQNPSEQDVATITSIISKNIINRFGKYEGVTEIAEKLPSKFSATRPTVKSQVANYVNREFDENPYSAGFHNNKFRHVFLRDEIENASDNESRFQVWLHESMHVVSIENGAGLSNLSGDFIDSFYIPDEILREDNALGAVYYGATALCEGATQLLTEQTEIDMGFPEAEVSTTYGVEVAIVSKIIDLIGEEKFREIYFTMPLEELRFKFEALGKDSNPDYANTFTTGDFARFLQDVGDCSNYCNNSLQENDNFNPLPSINECVGRLEEYLTETGYLS